MSARGPAASGRRSRPLAEIVAEAGCLESRTNSGASRCQQFGNAEEGGLLACQLPACAAPNAVSEDDLHGHGVSSSARTTRAGRAGYASVSASAVGRRRQSLDLAR